MKTLFVLIASLTLIASVLAADLVVKPFSVVVYPTLHMGTGCSSTYRWIAWYTTNDAGLWGRTFDTNNQPYTATDTNNPNVVVQYGNYYGPSGCATGSVTLVPTPACGPYNRFAVYGTNLSPSSNLVLHGFNP